MQISIVNECSLSQYRFSNRVLNLAVEADQGYDYNHRLCHNVKMDELKKLTNQLEYIFLKKIIEGLKDNSISIMQAKENAVLFLKLQPFSTLEDAKTKVKSFTSEHVQFSGLMELVDSFHTEQHTGKVIEKMRDFIKNDRLDEAIDVAKQTE